MPDQLFFPPKPLVVASEDKNPQQLFILLHGEAADPTQLQGLAAAIRQTFPSAAIVLPYGSFSSGQGSYRWIEQPDPDPEKQALQIAGVVPAFVGLTRQLQQHYGLSGEHTALAGFSQGAAVALEACSAQFDLAGRALLFSGVYPRPPRVAPPATTLHFLHGADDGIAPVELVDKLHARLAQLRGDATFDIASSVGHELHSALIAQAMLRLRTCVPLRSWETALNELAARSNGPAPDDPIAECGDPTLH